MHAVCGYPVKSTWLKAIAAGNFIGWPLLNVRNVKKYYPETTETPKGHMNQTRKNVRSTKVFKTNNATTLKGKKFRDIGIHIYNVRETIKKKFILNYCLQHSIAYHSLPLREILSYPPTTGRAKAGALYMISHVVRMREKDLQYLGRLL
jgi:hypothetical protein